MRWQGSLLLDSSLLLEVLVVLPSLVDSKNEHGTNGHGLETDAPLEASLGLGSVSSLDEVVKAVRENSSSSEGD